MSKIDSRLKKLVCLNKGACECVTLTNNIERQVKDVITCLSISFCDHLQNKLRFCHASDLFIFEF